MTAKLQKFGCQSRARFLTSLSLLLVFVLATHSFWCSSLAPLCEPPASMAAALQTAGATPTVHAEHRAPSRNHQHETCCTGIDETQAAATWHKLSGRPDAVTVVELDSIQARITAPLVVAENLFRRDGPEVRLQRAQYNRNPLPYRGPPASA